MSKSPSMRSRQESLRNSSMAHSALDYFSALPDPSSGLVPLDPTWIRLDMQAFSVPLDAIVIDEDVRLRRQCPADSLIKLVYSIQEHGVRHPVRIRLVEGKVVLSEGYRRVLACREAGLQRIPAYIENVNADSAFEWALVENMQRENLHPLEEADGIIELMRRRGYSQQEVSRLLGRSKAQISKYVRVSRLAKAVRQELEGADCGLEQIYQIAQQKGVAAQLALTRRILNQALSTRASRALARPDGPAARSTPHPILRYVEKLEKSCADQQQLQQLGEEDRLRLLDRLQALAARLNLVS